MLVHLYHVRLKRNEMDDGNNSIVENCFHNPTSMSFVYLTLNLLSGLNKLKRLNIFPYVGEQ